MNELLDNFKNPSAEYRTAPFWIWNDEMDKDEITRQLREMKSHGFGGAFVHARLGLISPYLTEEWFDFFSHTLKVCKELGMKLYIYDENNWPSGNAGGHVTHDNPEYGTHKLEKKVFSTSEAIGYNGRFVKAWICGADERKLEKDVSDIPVENWKDYGERVLVFWVHDAEPSGWFGNSPEVNNIDREAVAKFLEVTHEEYYKRYGEDFGDTIPAIFTDEPCQPRHPWDRGVQEVFYEMHGYRLEDYIPYIFDDYEGIGTDVTPEKVRYDYNETRHTMWTEAYMKQIGKWCDEHNIAFTGHLIEHEWPNTACPAPMSGYEYMQWPGTDGLCCHHLADVSYSGTSFQAEELRSVANQFGKGRILNEMYGCGMWDVTFEQLKRIEDWWMANGTNMMCQHLMHATITGLRKRDCVQSFDWRQPWWDQYAVLNEYTARAQYLLSSGKMHQRILLVNMSTSSYTIPADKQIGHVNGAVETDYIKSPDCTDFLNLIKEMTCQQWDYDIGDEYIMENNAKIEDGKFVIGLQKYDALIVSKNMKNMRAPTVRLLTEFVKAGGTVISTGNGAGEFVDGLRGNAEMAELRKIWWTEVSPDRVLKKLGEMFTRRIECIGGWPQGFEHMRRDYGDGRVGYFLINHTMKHHDLELVLYGTSASKWNLFTGEVEGLDYRAENGKLFVKVSLDWMQSVFIMTGDGTAPVPSPVYGKEEKVLPCFTGADREWLNFIPSLYCDLHVDGNEIKDVPYYLAQKSLFGHRGMRNPWDAVNYNYDALNKNHFEEGTGFEVFYRFRVKEGFRTDVLNLIAERPELINVDLNGETLKWDGTTHFMDRHMAVYPIADKIIDGVNTVRLWATKFDMRDEIEDIFVEGDFSVCNCDGEYSIGEKKEIGLGDWTQNAGMEFYPGAVVYHFDLDVGELPVSAVIDATDTQDTIISAKVNGRDAGLLGADGDRKAEIAPFLVKGTNKVDLRVCGSYCNLLGPIHYNIPKVDPDIFNFCTLPKGKRVKFGEITPHPYGLMSVPTVTLKY